GPAVAERHDLWRTAEQGIVGREQRCNVRRARRCIRDIVALIAICDAPGPRALADSDCTDAGVAVAKRAQRRVAPFEPGGAHIALAYVHICRERDDRNLNIAGICCSTLQLTQKLV